MALTVDQFVRRLVDAELFERRALNEFLTGLRSPPTDGQKLAKELVRRGKLTKYQAQVAYAGDGKTLVLGNYIILEKIGAGGMGEVYLAEHRRMGRKAALKILPAKVTDNPDAVRRFHREVQAVAKLSHPNIVGAFDAGESKGAHYCVMEFVEGRDLTTTVKQDGRLSEDQSVDCIIQAAIGLDYAHNEKVIHRDIKPANLLLDVNGVLKVLDLGLARFEQDGHDSLQTELTQTGTVMGTVDYMAPEQALNTKHADARSDIYSLGCTLFYLLNGRSVYQGETVIERILAHRDQPIPSLKKLRPEISPAVDTVFQKMIAKNPQDRFQSMRAVVEALNACRITEAATAADSTTAGTDLELRRFLTGIDEPATQTYVEPISPVEQPTEQLPVETQDIPALGNTFSLGLTKHPKKTVRDFLSDRRVQLWGGGVLGVIVAAILVATIFKQGDDPVDPDAPLEQNPSTTETAPFPAIAPFNSQKAAALQAAWAKHLGLPVEFTNSIGMKFRLIPPGEFLMGSSFAEYKAVKEQAEQSGEGWEAQFILTEMPQHKVRITRPFYIGVYEVTNEEYRQGDAVKASWNRHPVTNISYNQMQSFCRMLGQRDNATYRLPTEAEWEYSCRAGTTTAFSFGDSLSSHQANFNGEFPYGTAPKGPNRDRKIDVGTFQANPFGLYDMHGNVWEMCSDWYSPHYYKESPRDDPTGPASGSLHVERGGDYEKSRGYACRSALRHAWRPPYPSVGFRVVREIPVDASQLPPGGNGKKKPFTTPGAIDYALAFDGKDDYVAIPSLKFDPQKPFSIEALIAPQPGKPDETTLAENYDPVFVSAMSAPNLPAWCTMIFDRRNRAIWSAQVPSGNAQIRSASFKSDLLNDRHVVATVWDGKELRVYLNGRLMAQNAKLIPHTDKTRPEDFSLPAMIGRTFYISRKEFRYFYGNIDELRISKTARHTKNFTPEKRFTADKDTLALYHFNEGSGDVLKDSSGNNHHGKIHGAKWVKSDGTPINNYALSFDGKDDYVEIPTLTTVDSPLTYEAWLTPLSRMQGHIIWSGSPVWSTLESFQEKWQIGIVQQNAQASVWNSKNTIQPGIRVHLAATWDGQTGRLFVNGVDAGMRLQDVAGFRWSAVMKTFIGTQHTFSAFLHARIDELRISKTTRYTRNFTPQQRFNSDKDTIALYRFEEGAGDVLKDSSGNNHHGKIHGATWVKADGSPIKRHALNFDGKKSYVHIPRLPFKENQPCTIEARVKLARNASDIRVIFATSRAASGPVMYYDRDQGVSSIKDSWNFGFPAPQVTKKNRMDIGSPADDSSSWTHLAGTWDGQEMHFFVNGKLVKSAKILDTSKVESLAAYIGLYRFQKGSPDQVFHGLIDEFRFSNSVRYTTDFTPKQRFIPDKDTLALYHFDEGQGDVLKDSSGKNHHGKIYGATWVKEDR